MSNQPFLLFFPDFFGSTRLYRTPHCAGITMRRMGASLVSGVMGGSSAHGKSLAVRWWVTAKRNPLQSLPSFFQNTFESFEKLAVVLEIFERNMKSQKHWGPHKVEEPICSLEEDCYRHGHRIGLIGPGQQHRFDASARECPNLRSLDQKRCTHNSQRSMMISMISRRVGTIPATTFVIVILTVRK